MRAYTALLTILLLANSPSSAARQTRESPPHFEVASIKPSEPQPPGRNNSNIRRLNGGRFSASNARLKGLIQVAYRVQEFQIIGGPAWIDSEGFDIDAVPDREIVPDNPATDAMPRMLQMLLEERFQLKVHQEPREIAVYALVLGSTGPRLQETKQAGDKNSSFSFGPRGLTATNAPMSDFSGWLSGQLGRSVINKTGLDGYFDFTMRFVPDQLATNGPPSEGPSIFTALQEQLGLHLEPDKGFVEFIVIDSVQRPSEN